MLRWWWYYPKQTRDSRQSIKTPVVFFREAENCILELWLAFHFLFPVFDMLWHGTCYLPGSLSRLLQVSMMVSTPRSHVISHILIKALSSHPCIPNHLLFALLFFIFLNISWPHGILIVWLPFLHINFTRSGIFFFFSVGSLLHS